MVDWKVAQVATINSADIMPATVTNSDEVNEINETVTTLMQASTARSYFPGLYLVCISNLVRIPTHV